MIKRRKKSAPPREQDQIVISGEVHDLGAVRANAVEEAKHGAYSWERGMGKTIVALVDEVRSLRAHLNQKE